MTLRNPSRGREGAEIFDLDANDKAPFPYGHGSDYRLRQVLKNTLFPVASNRAVDLLIRLVWMTQVSNGVFEIVNFTGEVVINTLSLAVYNAQFL